MDARAEALHANAAQQIDTLIEFAADLDTADLRRPCPGRERLGDGSVGTLLAHTTDNYLRIAAFLRGEASPTEGGHRPGHHGPTKAADPDELRHRLARARVELGRIAELDSDELDSIPPAGSFRFSDGNRTVEQVIDAVLTHQGHQVEALAHS
jgi:DinB family protein